MQQKEFASTPTPLAIEDEDEITYQSTPITQQPAMQQTQKEMQIKPQKEIQVKPQKEVQVKPQKEVQKKFRFKKRSQLKSRLSFKTTCCRESRKTKTYYERKH